MEFSESRLADRLVLLAIAHRVSNDTGAAFPSLATICHEARVSERTAHYALRQLEGLGELEIETKASDTGTNLYRLPKFAAWLQGIRGAHFAPVPAKARCKIRRGEVQTLQRRGAKYDIPPTPPYMEEPSLNHQGTVGGTAPPLALPAAAALVLTSPDAKSAREKPAEERPAAEWGELDWIREFLWAQRILEIPHELIAEVAPGQTLYDPEYWRLVVKRCGGHLTPALLEADFAGMAMWLANNPQKHRTPAGWRPWISKWLVRTVTREVIPNARINRQGSGAGRGSAAPAKSQIAGAQGYQGDVERMRLQQQRARTGPGDR